MGREFGAGKYLSLWVFGIAFGYTEAAVVVYLRAVLELEDPGLFPLSKVFSERHAWYLTVETYRELAALALMLVPALLVSRIKSFRLLSFALIFAVWDLSYYFFLQLTLDWPRTFLTYDVLFLIPTVWVAPVLCPVLISAAMVCFSTVLIYIGRHRPMRTVSPVHWLPLVTGAILMLYAFMAEADYFLAGGLPPRFPWWPFGIGFALASLAGLHFTYGIARKERTRFG